MVKFPLAHPTSSAIARRFSFRCDWPTATLRDQPYRHNCADRTTSQPRLTRIRLTLAFRPRYANGHATRCDLGAAKSERKFLDN
ncbi:hypothetical protein [Moorena producens]|uniref:hypothetical protein n=1 Tax=Moorena producens TaxID=1155739 RepID=UPI003C717BD4